MFSAIVGLSIALLFGFCTGHARQSKWPVAEIITSCAVALLMVVLVLLFRQHTQGACLQPSYYAPYGSSGVCMRIFTWKNVGIGYAAFGFGLMLGLIYRFIDNKYDRRTTPSQGKDNL